MAEPQKRAWTELREQYPVGTGLTPFLQSVQSGSDLDIRTPFWKGISREEVVDQWDKIFNEERGRLPGRLSEVEENQRGKIGPLSIRDPLAKRIPQINGYWTTHVTSVPKEVQRFDALSGIFGGTASRLRPLSAEQAGLELAGNTNSGFPYFTKKRRVREDTLKYTGEDYLRTFPAILGWRGQSQGIDENPKQRTVWMYPFSTNIEEMRYFRPLQTFLLQASPNPLAAWVGPDETDAEVKRCIAMARANDTSVVSTDFSSFDQSIGPELSRSSYEYISKLFTDDSEGEISELHSVMHNIDLIVNPTVMLSGEHGVSSGSVMTNLIDSLVHLVAATFTMQLARCELLCVQVQGDDGLLVPSRRCDPEEIVAGYHEIGLDANPDKQFIGDQDCLYLQKYYHASWNEGGVGMYPTYRALNSLLGQERFYSDEEWGADMVTLRAIMILENAKGHPLFTRLVQFAMDGDRYRLGARWPGGIDNLLFKNDVIQRAKSLAGFVPVYNKARDVSGIRQFKTYQLIKELE